MEDESDGETSAVSGVPDSILLNLFCNLVARDVLSSARVCQRWYAVTHDESLWRNLVNRKWKIDEKLPPGRTSWRSEYKRLYFHAPLIWSETLTEHTDEVLHVCFAHNGSLFATTSKDCTVKVGEPTQV